MSSNDASRGINLDPIRHISGLGENLSLLSLEQQKCVQDLFGALVKLPEYDANVDYICDSVLVKFLIARDWDHEKTLKMLLPALQWRTRRPSHRWHLQPAGSSSGTDSRVVVDEARLRLFAENATTGKIRVSGTDHHGRPVMILDNSRENTNSTEAMLEYLAFNMELCAR